MIYFPELTHNYISFQRLLAKPFGSLQDKTMISYFVSSENYITWKRSHCNFLLFSKKKLKLERTSKDVKVSVCPTQTSKFPMALLNPGHIFENPVYSSGPIASFSTSLSLTHSFIYLFI